jgi:DNA repair protein RecN (Recombination protein N)
MIRFLSIRRLAVIDELDVEFRPGLNVLTGETGAGKSIVVQAIALLLGARAAADLVRTGSDSAQVQAQLEARDGRDVVVRREISAQGRSRAFIDDALVSAGALALFTRDLIELHGQHDHQVLLDPDSHLDLLDEHAGLLDQRVEVERAFAEMRNAASRLEPLVESRSARAARVDVIRYQLADLDRLATRAGEDDDLRAARLVLANGERLRWLTDEAYHALYEGEAAVLGALGRIWRSVAELASLDPAFGPYLAARDGVRSQLEDLAFFLRAYGAGIDASPERLGAVESRLAAIERLQHRHGVGSAAQLASLAERLRGELDALDQSEEDIRTCERTLAAARKAYVECALQLSARRRPAAEDLCRRLESLLGDLAMPATRCEYRWRNLAEGEWGARGLDAGALFLSANPGEELRRLDAIASGGELSRLMLAIRSLAAREATGKTLVFDEVDAGIGGATADVVGGKLRALATTHQVLCITHLPQVAAHGTVQFHVSKAVDEGRTRVRVQLLDSSQRIHEIARMMGGEVIGAATIAGARELLARRGESESEQKTKGESSTTRGAKRRERKVGQEVSD